MNSFFSLFSKQGRRRKKTENGWASSPQPAEGALSSEGAEAFLRMITESVRGAFSREISVPFHFSEPVQTGNAGDGRQEEFYSDPAFYAEVREEDIPFRRGGFVNRMSGEGQASSRESFRILFERTDEMKESLSQLTEKADEIRKELTI